MTVQRTLVEQIEAEAEEYVPEGCGKDFLAGARTGIRLLLESEEMKAVMDALSACHSCWESNLEPHPRDTALISFSKLKESLNGK